MKEFELDPSLIQYAYYYLHEKFGDEFIKYNGNCVKAVELLKLYR